MSLFLFHISVTPSPINWIQNYCPYMPKRQQILSNIALETKSRDQVFIFLSSVLITLAPEVYPSIYRSQHMHYKDVAKKSAHSRYYFDQNSKMTFLPLIKAPMANPSGDVGDSLLQSPLQFWWITGRQLCQQPHCPQVPGAERGFTREHTLHTCAQTQVLSKVTSSQFQPSFWHVWCHRIDQLTLRAPQNWLDRRQGLTIFSSVS